MKRIFKTKTFLGLATASLLMVGCVNDKIDGPSVSNTTQTEIENAFDFSSTKDVTISLDYPTFAHVEIYDKLPTEEGAKLLFRTYTGANGAFEGITTLPSAYIGKTVYVIANGINCPAVSEAQILKKVSL